MQPYDYITHKPDYFSFITANGCEYHCYFYEFPTPFADYPTLAPKVFGFNLELKHQPTNLTTLAPDKKIAATVTTILKAFLQVNGQVAVYICDNSDNREKARFHKFNHWFKSFNDGSVIQLKGVIKAHDLTIYHALLIHRNNPLLNEFIEAHEILTGIYTKPDDDELMNILNDAGW